MESGLGVMAGDSYYQQHSLTQRAAGALGLSHLDDALTELVPHPPRPLIADFGAAQGRNSDAPMARIIDGLPDAAEVVAVHTDLPGNDWAALVQHVESAPTSYRRGRDNVRTLLAAGTFYDRLLPERSLSIGWTSAAVHWLSGKPCGIADHFFVQASTDRRAQRLYREQSRRDWAAFLRHRGAELADRGSIVFVDVLMDDAGSTGNEGLFDCVESALRWARTENLISEPEYQGMAYPAWFRTLDELREPFPVLVPGGGILELVIVEPVQMEDPFLSDYRRSGDAAAYARAQVGFLKGFLGPSFASALADGDPVRLDPVWERARDLIAADPESVSPVYRLVSGRVRMVADG